MANMRRSRTGDWSVVIGPGPTVHFFYIFSFSSLVRVVANLRRCLGIIILATTFPPKVDMRSMFWLRAQDGCLIY